MRCLLACALLLSGADDFSGLLSRAIGRYEKLDDARALELLESARRAARGPADLAQIALYRGLALAHQGDAEPAAAAFRVGLYLDPKLALPTVAREVRERFEQAAAAAATETGEAPAVNLARAEKALEGADFDFAFAAAFAALPGAAQGKEESRALEIEALCHAAYGRDRPAVD